MPNRKAKFPKPSMSKLNTMLNLLSDKKSPKRDASIYMSENADYADYDIGQFTYGRPKIYSWDKNTKLFIGKFCSFAANVTILLGGEHRTDWVTTYPFNILFDEAKQYQGHPATKGDIVIGNDVWIGTGAVILSGVTIGDGAVVAAETVITKSVEPYTIVGGNPQKEIRKRFAHEQVEALLRIQWWNWPIDKVLNALPFMLNNHIDDFISRYSYLGR